MPVLWNVAQEKYCWAQDFQKVCKLQRLRFFFAHLINEAAYCLSAFSTKKTFFCIQNIIEWKLYYIISDEAGVHCAEHQKSQVICRWVGGPELLSLLLFAALVNHSYSCLWDICLFKSSKFHPLNSAAQVQNFLSFKSQIYKKLRFFKI